MPDVDLSGDWLCSLQNGAANRAVRLTEAPDRDMRRNFRFAVPTRRIMLQVQGLGLFLVGHGERV